MCYLSTYFAWKLGLFHVKVRFDSLQAYCPKHTKNQNATESESPKKEDLNENDVSEAEMAKKRSEK